jgi:hypothetical protein
MSSEIVFIDFKGTVPEFVHWEYQDIQRFPSFTAYLEQCMKDAEELLELETRRLR